MGVNGGSMLASFLKSRLRIIWLIIFRNRSWFNSMVYIVLFKQSPFLPLSGWLFGSSGVSPAAALWPFYRPLAASRRSGKVSYLWQLQRAVAMGKWNNDYNYHNDSWSVNKNHNQWKKSSNYHRQSSWHNSDSSSLECLGLRIWLFYIVSWKESVVKNSKGTAENIVLWSFCIDSFSNIKQPRQYSSETLNK